MTIPLQQLPNRIKSGKVASSLFCHQQDAAASRHHGPSTEQVNGVSEHNRSQWTMIGKTGKAVPAKQPYPKKKQRIQGCGQSDIIRGVPPPKRDYIISRVHTETDDDGMKTYNTNKGVQDCNLSLVSNVNAMFKSSKLSISISKLNEVLCSEI